jgi:hypothetical protein
VASDPQLLAAVRSGLITAQHLGYDAQSEAHDVYEAYILTLLIRAADNLGWQWELHDQSCSVTNRAVFRKGPGRLPTGNFTHVMLSKANKQDLEAHIGVKVRGISGVAHEFDLLLISESAAALRRSQGFDPDYTDVVAHAEAKYYGGNLPLPLGRSMVGLDAECYLAGKSVLVTNQNGGTVDNLITHYGVSFRFLVRPGRSQAIYHMTKLFEDFLHSAP